MRVQTAKTITKNEEQLYKEILKYEIYKCKTPTSSVTETHLIRCDNLCNFKIRSKNAHLREIKRKL